MTQKSGSLAAVSKKCAKYFTSLHVVATIRLRCGGTGTFLNEFVANFAPSIITAKEFWEIGHCSIRHCYAQEISCILFSTQSGPWPGSVLSRASQYASNLRQGRYWLFGVVDGTSKSAKVRARLHEVEHRKRTGLRSKHDSDIVKVVNQYYRTNPVA